MAMTYKKCEELFNKTVNNLSNSRNEWTRFLKTVSNTYKYDLHEQILIYAQYPKAVACADFNIWSKKFNRKIRNNAEGIALITNEQGKYPKLRYVFDISQTLSRTDSKQPYIWYIEDGFSQNILNFLKNKHNLSTYSLDETTIAIAEQKVDELFSNYIFDIIGNKGNSLLSNLENKEIEIQAKKLVKESVKYIVLSRCGFDTTSYFDNENFNNLLLYDTKNVIMAVANAISHISKETLTEIENTVKSERNKYYGYNNVKEKNNQWNTTPAMQSGYDLLSNNKSKQDEWSNIHSMRRYDRRSSDLSSGLGNIIREQQSGQIWKDEIKVSSREQRNNVSENVVGGNSLPTFGRDRQISGRNEGQIDRTDDGTAGSERGTERQGLADIFTQVGNDLSTSGGNSSERPDLRINKSANELIVGDKIRLENQEWIIERISNDFSLLLKNINQNAEQHHKAIVGNWQETLTELNFEYISHETDYELEQGKRFQNNKEKTATEEHSEVAVSVSEDKIIGNTTFKYISKKRYRKVDSNLIDKISERLEENNIKFSGKITGNKTTFTVSQNDIDMLDYIIKSIDNQFTNNDFSDNNYEQISFLLNNTEVVDERQVEVEQFINHCLMRGTGFEDGKYKVQKYFSESHTKSELAEFLKNEYGWGSSYTTDYHISYEPKGMVLQKPNPANNSEYIINVKLTWSQTAEYIKKLIDKNEYFTEKDKKILITSAQTNTPENDTNSTVKNYHITNDNLGIGTVAEKYQRNIHAIKTLKSIENENRFATFEEQKIISEYVGWGGLSEYFSDDKSNELKELLSDEEFTSARSSTLNAHYTSPTIIKAMYQALINMRFEGGKILEPSCGVGNFIGLVPEKISNNPKTKITGIELDSLSGRLAKALYPNADIQICGFEHSKVKDNYFDIVIGNVPFGDYRVYDLKYNKHNFLIHDYFFSKSLELVKPDGIVAFITSKGTLDKKDAKVRKYLAERAILIGAIRLPNNAFLSNAGTSVTSDIIFLQKREHQITLNENNTPNWVNISANTNDIVINNYFIEHPEMILGKMEMQSGRFGPESTCTPNANLSLQEQLAKAITNLHAEIRTIDIQEEITQDNTDIPIPDGLKNNSFFVFDDKVYYRQNLDVSEVTVEKKEPKDKIERLKGLVELRDTIKELLNIQVYDCSDNELLEQQSKANIIYDNFVRKFGRIADSENKKIFKKDTSSPLMLSLEKYDSDKNFVSKADIFTKRTIRAKQFIDSATNSIDALAISMSNTAKVDLKYMSELTGFTQDKIINDLKGVIYKEPVSQQYIMSDEYLSGNIREKLATAQLYQTNYGGYEKNILALGRAMPKPLEVGEVSIQMGATWIKPEYYQNFLYDLLQTPFYQRVTVSPQKNDIAISFSEYTGEWNIANKSKDNSNINASTTYGIKELNAYHIFEDCLNLRRSQVWKKIIDIDGKEKSIIDVNKTEQANNKQELIKDKFKEWIFKNKERRDDIVKTYNELFNSVRPREYDGKYLEFVGMNSEITLMEHQKNAVAHALYGGNTLLAHVVGAGKSFEMIAIAMEGKRLGLHNKSLFCVPNHLTEQIGNDFLFLYPNANVLVATTEDFTEKNRKKLCAKIATNDYDAVIIGHSQLGEKITLSVERQQQFISKQLIELEESIRECDDRFSIKELEKAKKNLQNKLKELIESPKRDDVVSFEELGIDKLFLDEAHEFKNLRISTKMRNVAGIQTNSKTQKTMNLYMICQYLDSITGGKGIVFATGTPVSNSMCEIYNMQKYLQDGLLRKYKLYNFDAWASNFGEVVTKPQLAPEGNTYRPKTSFSKFHNLPELMSLFKECADIKTADTLNLPVPECEVINVTAKPSELQKELIQTLSERADKIHNREIPPEIDNMLKITTDGKKIGLDARLINPDLPDFDGSKVNKCVENVYNIWNETKEQKSTQLIFCDFSTPNKDGKFNVYDDIKSKLILKGVSADEIAFIHDAKNEDEKEILFAKVRAGEIRVLLGSTKKMGAGTNVQERLIASHDLDAPYRPSDLEQRKGRMVRQGNTNKHVKLFRYITQDTFDAYLFQMLENKQKFISQIMMSKTPVRDCDDIDEVTLSYAETKALCTSNPLIGEKMNLDVEVAKLKMMKSNYLNEKYRLEDEYYNLPKKIDKLKENLNHLISDKEMVENLPKVFDEKGNETFVGLTVDSTKYMDKEKAGEELKKAYISACSFGNINKKTDVGSYKGFTLSVYFDAFSKVYKADLSNNCTLTAELGESNIGNIIRLDNAIASLPKRIENVQSDIDNQNKQLSIIKESLDKPFAKEEELQTKLSRLKELEKLLDCSGKQDTSGNLDKDVQEQKNNSYNQQNDIEDDLDCEEDLE